MGSKRPSQLLEPWICFHTWFKGGSRGERVSSSNSSSWSSSRYSSWGLRLAMEEQFRVCGDEEGLYFGRERVWDLWKVDFGRKRHGKVVGWLGSDERIEAMYDIRKSRSITCLWEMH